jgi:hypothetical protein
MTNEKPPGPRKRPRWIDNIADQVRRERMHSEEYQLAKDRPHYRVMSAGAHVAWTLVAILLFPVGTLAYLIVYLMKRPTARMRYQMAMEDYRRRHPDAP